MNYNTKLAEFLIPPMSIVFIGQPRDSTKYRRKHNVQKREPPSVAAGQPNDEEWYLKLSRRIRLLPPAGL